MLEVVRQKFHALPSSAQQQINESDSFRVMFIEEVSKELDMSPDEIKVKLDQIYDWNDKTIK